MYVVRAPALDFQSPRTTNSLPASPLGCVTHPTSNDKICRATVLPWRCSFLCSSQLAGTTSYLLSAMLAPNTASTGLPCSASDPASLCVLLVRPGLILDAVRAPQPGTVHEGIVLVSLMDCGRTAALRAPMQPCLPFTIGFCFMKHLGKLLSQVLNSRARVWPLCQLGGKGCLGRLIFWRPTWVGACLRLCNNVTHVGRVFATTTSIGSSRLLVLFV